MTAPPAPVVVASNRGPLGFTRSPTGELVVRRGAGGLVVTIGPGAARDGATWVAAALGDADREAAAGGARLEAGGLVWEPVLVDPAAYRAYYDVVANSALWYLFHGMWDAPRRPRFDRRWHEAWAAYRSVNEAFADAVAAVAAPGATVLVQDYHLGLVGARLASARPDLATSMFVHTPWCTPAELGILPDRAGAELMASMCSFGAVGFHVRRWSERFEACCAAMGLDAPATFTSPAAADAGDLLATAASEVCRVAGADLEAKVGERALIVRVDRIELSKNLLRGFWAFDELLETRPHWRGKVVFGAFVYPSRQGLADYLAYGQEVQSLVEHLNAKWGDPDWTPILLDTADDYPRSVAALCRYDVLLVNPIRDGLNLVATEGPVVNRRHGTVVLSSEAGAAQTPLADHALVVNPFDVTATADALATGLARSAPVRAAAAAGLQAAAAGATPLGWWDAQVAAARVPGAG